VGDAAQTPHGGDQPIDDEAMFRKRMTVHRARMIKGSPQHSVFITKYLTDIGIRDLASLAAKKMHLTQSGGAEHSVALIESPICYVVCTIPVGIERASAWYEERYGGYFNVLERCWNSSGYIDHECQVLVHITYGRGKAAASAWVNATIAPVRSRDFSFGPLFAIDLLSQAERKKVDRQMGSGLDS